jgi:hypothetical protein
MKRTYLFIFMCLSSSLWVAPVKTSAHFLETDGTIGAVLHLDPNDDPIAGQASAFFLEFKDKSGKFDPLTCTCTADIYKGEQKLASLPLFTGNGSRYNSGSGQATGNASYTFLSKDIYVMKVVGVPIQSGTFQPFTLVFNIRVDRDISSASAASPISTFLRGHNSYGVLIGIGLVVIVTLFILSNYKSKRHE